MPRLDQDRQKKLEPKRIDIAKIKIQDLGYSILKETSTSIQFEFKGSIITYYPYSGWASGKTINDGRGLDNLLKQIKL